MISYQWDCQEIILRVKDELRSAGFNVWIDVEKIEGSTLQSMASAVENCAVFVMAVSRKYFESPNCRSGKSRYKFTFLLPYMSNEYAEIFFKVYNMDLK